MTEHRHRRSWLLVACALAAFAVTAALGAAPAWAARGLVLHARSRQASYRAGSPVQLDLTLTNRTRRSIELAGLDTGTVTIDSVRRAGPSRRARAVRVHPIDGEIYYDDGLSGALIASLHRVGRGRSIRLSETSGLGPSGTALQSVSFGRYPQSTSVALYELTTPGHYTVKMHYRLPARGATASSHATVHFRIRGAQVGRTGRLPGFRARAARRHNGPQAVAATIVPLAGSGSAFLSALANCEAQFQSPGGDPRGIYGALSRSPEKVIIGQTSRPRNYTTASPIGSNARPNGTAVSSGGSGDPAGSQIGWNPNNVTPFRGTRIRRDPCASLYHELFHAYQNALGLTDRRPYGLTGVPDNEVEAVRAENDYRRAKGLPLRADYDGLPVPLPLTTPPPSAPSPNPPAVNECSGVPSNNNQPCFLRIEVNGDPDPDGADGDEPNYGVGVVTVTPSAGQPTFAQDPAPFPSGTWASQFNDDAGCDNGYDAVDECYQFQWSSPQTITLTAYPVPEGGYDDASGSVDPDYNSDFVGWGGDCASAGSASTCTLHIGTQRGQSGVYSLSVVAYFGDTGAG